MRDWESRQRKLKEGYFRALDIFLKILDTTHPLFTGSTYSSKGKQHKVHFFSGNSTQPKCKAATMVAVMLWVQLPPRANSANCAVCAARSIHPRCKAAGAAAVLCWRPSPPRADSGVLFSLARAPSPSTKQYWLQLYIGLPWHCHLTSTVQCFD